MARRNFRKTLHEAMCQDKEVVLRFNKSYRLDSIGPANVWVVDKKYVLLGDQLDFPPVAFEYNYISEVEVKERVLLHCRAL